MELLSSNFLFNVCGENAWKTSHAMMPTPQLLEDYCYRIFFGCRNATNQSHIGSFIIDTKNNSLVNESSLVLGPGALGCFDDNGVLPSCCITFRGKVLLYYIGFKPGGTTRMDLFGGLAVLNETTQTFERWSQAPILERNKVNPFINTAPYVVEWKDELLMYYVAGVEWVHADLPRYNIQIAKSKDGYNWVRHGQIAIDFEEGENALARPFVFEDDGMLKMLFSSKGNRYSIMYAESKCGFKWARKKFVNSAGATENIDDDMQCYPVLIGKEKNKILFNGNGYGKTGILIGEVAV